MSTSERTVADSPSPADRAPVLSVFGLGRLGAPIAACFAARGLQVIGVDVDPSRVHALQSRDQSLYEPGLGALVQAGGDRLRGSSSAHEAVSESDVTFIVVGTPSESDGGFSLRYVLAAVEEIGAAVRAKNRFHLVVLTSTVMPGATDGEVRAALERASGKRCGVDFGLCYSPEFVALGTVIHDFYHPDLLLIGESDPRSGDILESIYQRTCKNSPAIARMSIVNAEVTKLAVNSFVTMKISYANMLARLCEKLPGADASVVTGALGCDTRIGPKYLKGAVSYGGPCFPRDNRAMAVLASRVGSAAELAEVTDRFNRDQVRRLADLVRSHAGDGVVGILGLTYKTNTDVVEESFGLLLALELSRTGFPVVVFDPAADTTAALAESGSVRRAGTAEACIDSADVVVVATPWPAFMELPAERWERGHSTRMVIDCWGVLRHLETTTAVRYLRLGSGANTADTVQQMA